MWTIERHRVHNQNFDHEKESSHPIRVAGTHLLRRADADHQALRLKDQVHYEGRVGDVYNETSWRPRPLRGTAIGTVCPQ